LATILDGNNIAAKIKDEVAAKVKELAAEGIRPGLAAVLVGEDPASEIYVRSKVRVCEQLGVFSEKISPPASSTTEQILDLINLLNQREDVDGILVQLPLPPHIDSKRVLLAVCPEKDVDGFHPVNVGNLSTQRPGLTPCTPAGIMEILRRSGIEIAGRSAVVLGRSDIVGKPIAMMLMNANATVTVCHSRTVDLPAYTSAADILVAAIGKAAMVKPEMVKPGAAVIDVGINRLMDKNKVRDCFGDDPKKQEEFAAKGSILIGDVHPRAAEVAGAITPVPGGVGPLTIAMLMSNTVKAARLRRGMAVQ
jgi:methylenetetrahydrofolate dehydrogenase (NADP+) / methenyltetrahydrofolate cyclohydrolase